MDCPYHVLGCSPDVSQTELRAAYKRMALRTHPDAGGTTDDFVAVQQAWARVRSPELRRRWDLYASQRSAAPVRG